MKHSVASASRGQAVSVSWNEIHYNNTRKSLGNIFDAVRTIGRISGTRSSVPRIYTRRIIAMIRADRSGPSIPFAEAYCESVQTARRATYQAASEPARNERWLVHYIVLALCTRNKSMPLTKATWKLIGHSRWDLDHNHISSGWVRWLACCLFRSWRKVAYMCAQEDQSKKR